mmetsp:Transcript_9834/g.19452  ORF Transcript_9834/g.19452 Transcript_9834/m.19452 type:complete len:238 (-) Transcript_9834:276-989(-)
MAVDETQMIPKDICCGLLFVCYLFTLCWSLKQQHKHFGKSRFLEMCYYVITFYLGSNPHAARLVYVLVFVLDLNIVVVALAEFLPNVLIFCICSMVTYFWVTIIWSLDESSKVYQTAISRAYAIVNLVTIAVYAGVQIGLFASLRHFMATEFIMITSSCLYILCSIEVWYVARKLNHTYLMSNLNTKHMQTVSVYSKWFVVLVCLARSATGFVMVGCIHSFVRIQELFKISRMPLYR